MKKLKTDPELKNLLPPLTQNKNKKKSENEKLLTWLEGLQKNEKENVNEERNNTKLSTSAESATPKTR